MSLLPQRPKHWSEAPIWQEVEFGSYTADLPLWEELAADVGGPVLELGAGSGRVALHLARAGFEVIAAERDPELVEELERRAEGLPLTVLAADITRLDESSLPTTTVRLAIGPLQVVQMLDQTHRARVLGAVADALQPGGRCALSLVDESTLIEQGVAATPPPDMREVEGWVYSSEPLWVQVSERSLRMRRLRERVSPTGDLVRKVHDDLLHRLRPEQLEAEAGAVGLKPAARLEVAPSAYEAGAIAVILEPA